MAPPLSAPKSKDDVKRNLASLQNFYLLENWSRVKISYIFIPVGKVFFACYHKRRKNPETQVVAYMKVGKLATEFTARVWLSGAALCLC